jgi:Ca2+-binding EF-hand superfamily protein
MQPLLVVSDVPLRPEAVDKLKDVFREIDTDGSGTVSFAEFSQACHKLSIEVGEEELKEFKKSDASGDNELCFEEFCTFYINRLRSAFNEIDVDGSGNVGAVELKGAFEMLGFRATLREVQLLLLKVDKDRNEVVDLEEFCNFFCFLPSPDIRVIMEQWTSGLSIDTGSIVLWANTRCQVAYICRE